MHASAPSNDPSSDQVIQTQDSVPVVTPEDLHEEVKEPLVPDKRSGPDPPRTPKYRRIGNTPLLKFSENLNLTRQTVWHGEDPETLTQGLYIREVPIDDPWTQGCVIIDGLAHWSRSDLYLSIKKTLPEVAACLRTSDINKMNKGGFILKIRPDHARHLRGWRASLIEHDNVEDVEAVRIQPPRSILEGKNRSAILYNVPINVSEESLQSKLLPPVESVQRFTKNGFISNTVKVTFHSEIMAKWVVKHGEMSFDGHQILKAVKFRSKRNRPFCRTCKRPKAECPNGNKCTDIRCAHCGEAHKSSECPSDVRMCQECHEMDHTTYNCPVLRLKEQERQIKIRESRKRSHNKHLKQASMSYANALAGGLNQSQAIQNPPQEFEASMNKFTSFMDKVYDKLSSLEAQMDRFENNNAPADNQAPISSVQAKILETLERLENRIDSLENQIQSNNWNELSNEVQNLQDQMAVISVDINYDDDDNPLENTPYCNSDYDSDPDRYMDFDDPTDNTTYTQTTTDCDEKHHLEINNPRNERNLFESFISHTCKACNTDYGSVEELQEHLRTHINCKYCRLVTSDPDVMDRHVQLYHTPHHCNNKNCEETFDNFMKFLEHRKLYHSKVYMNERQREHFETMIATTPKPIRHIKRNNAKEVSNIVTKKKNKKTRKSNKTAVRKSLRLQQAGRSQ